VLLGGIFGLPLVALAVLALTSAASAAGTLALARRGAPRELVSGAGKEIDSGRA